MSKNILLNGETYIGVSTVQLPTDTGDLASFKDVDEIIVPAGILNITENGTHNVSEYASVIVNVTSGESGTDNLYFTAMSDQGINGEFVDNQLINVRMYAFSGSSLLTSVSLLNANKVYGYAFNACNILKSVNLPVCTNISDFAFNGCKQLATLNLPLVETVGASAFYTCSTLTEIDLPKCTTIKSKAFGFCTSLNKITLRSQTMCTLANVDAFRNIGKNVQVEVPANLVMTYQADATWSAVTGATLEFVAIS
jgi:hypothetical protein